MNHPVIMDYVFLFIIVGIPLLWGLCAYILYPIYCIINQIIIPYFKRDNKYNPDYGMIDIKEIIYESAFKYNYSNDTPDSYYNWYKYNNKNIKTQYCKSCGAPNNYSTCKYCGV